MLNAFLAQYRKIARLGGYRGSPYILLGVAGLVLLVSLLIALVMYNLLPFLLGAVVASFIFYKPYNDGLRRIQEIEENLPDALKQIATTLKAGGTFEMAVREVVSADYGYLSAEFRRVLNDLESGNTIDVALQRMADRVPSGLLNRIVTIIVDAFHAGGGMAAVLEDVADDARETWKLIEERKTKTTMQAMFLVMASVVLAPFIVGAAFGIMDFFVIMGKQFAAGGVTSTQQYAQILSSVASLKLFLTFYVLFQAALAAFMLAAIREGKLSPGFRSVAIFTLGAYLVMIGSESFVRGLLHG